MWRYDNWLTLPSLQLAFDEGHLDRDPAAAQKEISQTLAVLDEGKEIPDRDLYPLQYLFYTVWERVRKVGITAIRMQHKRALLTHEASQRSSFDMQLQFKATHQKYLNGLGHQVDATRNGSSHT